MLKTNKILLLVLATFLFSSFAIAQNANSVKIEWVDGLEGDYSFADKWSYPYNVFVTDEGQLVCDGLCSDELVVMRDENGRILKDSLERYYQLLDTTHQYHTFLFIDTMGEDILGYMDAKRIDNDTVSCHASDVYAGYYSLNMKLIGNICIPVVSFMSITPSNGEVIYDCKEGTIKIDNQLWKQGILKAEYKFTFKRSEYVDSDIWQGRIYTAIE